LKPKMLIGSSVESLGIAYAAQNNLERDTEVTVWAQGILDLSKHTLQVLVGTIDEFDFGIFIPMPDDTAKINERGFLYRLQQRAETRC
jgi:predicted nucleotide-binding protein